MTSSKVYVGSSKVYVGSLSVSKKDGQCAHPTCEAIVDWSKHDKPPPGWATIVFDRYQDRKKGGGFSRGTYIVCPQHTLAFSVRQPSLVTKVKRFVRTVIESPYAGDVVRNLAYLKAAMKDSLGRGEAPFASHLLYTGVLNDEIPEERALGIAAGFAWGEAADKIAVYSDLGISSGMEQGLKVAEDRGRIIERRSLKEWASAGERGLDHDVDVKGARKL